MRIVSNTMLIISGVYLALGLIYLRFWLAERKRLDYLAFTLCCISVTLFSWFELSMMHSQTPEEYLFYIWWNFLIGILPTLSIAWFAYENLGGRRWLFLTYCAFRLLGVLVHLIMANGINFREITSIGRMNVLGETLSYPIAVPNPWMILPHLSHILLIIFCVDASIRAWKRGERRKAFIFGTGVVLHRTLVLIAGSAVLWGLVQFPFFVSFSIVFVIAAMLYELNYDMHRAAMLTEQLAERDVRLTETVEQLQEGKAQLTETLEQLQLSAAAANVGMWTRKIGEEKVWFSEKACEIWGFPKGEQINRETLIQVIHPDDRELYITNIRELDERKDEYQIEYRVLQKDGSVRWIYSRGKVEPVNGSRIVRGAIVDITKLKVAEEKAWQNEEQNTAIVAAISDMIFLIDAAGFYLTVHAKHPDEPLLPPDQLVGKNLRDVLPKAVTDEFFRSFESAAKTHETQTVEYKLRKKDGDHWYETHVVSMGDKFLTVARDITRIKVAYKAVHDLSQRLMNAQEKERARLARELHDDLIQSISLLSVDLTMLRNEPKDLEYVKDQLDQLISEVKRLLDDIRRISHELHPAILNQLGLEAALHSFCRDLNAAHHLEIDFDAENLPRNLPDDISLCLYRVTQESLQNVIKHSRATRAVVSIKSEQGAIHLSVSDNGNGFDPEAAKSKESLGLISIDERVRAVKGDSEIISAIGEGTRIEVYIPVNK